MINLVETEKQNSEAKALWAKLRPEMRKRANRNTTLVAELNKEIDITGTMQKMAADNIAGYDRYIVAFSGGKDSLATLIWLLDQGIDKSTIELHHHDVDGREGSKMFDWAVTKSYCESVAAHFQLPLTYSWRIGGIEGEILKENAQSAGIKYTTPDGDVIELGTNAKVATRRKFPAIVADLRTRWCSSLVKIDVFSRWLNSCHRFVGKRILVLTGERAQESVNRASYNYAEAHKTNSSKKTVHAIRPILSWGEQRVWDAIKAAGINPHPAYQLGFSRVSCATCIFNGKNEFATIRRINPTQFNGIANLEAEINFTMKADINLDEFADKGEALSVTPEIEAELVSDTYTQGIYVGSAWKMPEGAFRGGSCGSV